MSYCSENKLPLATPKSRLFEVLELLGFQRIQDSAKIEGKMASFVWSGSDEWISYVGIELYVYKLSDCISVQTRTRSGRSFWDLKQQNKTISLLKSLFGGTFITDEGEGRYLHNEDPEPSKIASSLYVDRWRFHNAMIKVQIYLNSRNMTGDIAKEAPTGLEWLDELNPRILSNNILLPYMIGCWESYFRNSFISILKNVDSVSPTAVKKCNPSTAEYMKVIHGETTLECVLADNLSFQRPSIIAQNFKALDLQIDIATWLKKPYHRRKKSLYDSITEIVEKRDSIVHMAMTDTSIFDKQICGIAADLNEAVDRCYRGFGQVLAFDPSYDF